MASIHFDFTESATRKTILEQLSALAGAEATERVRAQAREAEYDIDHCLNVIEVNEVIDRLSVDDQVKADMRGVYDILAHAEAQVHGCAVEDTHFHEVGNASGICNALEICLMMRAVASPDDRITATSVQTGAGKVKCAHGLMDIPAPATAAILSTGVPTCAEKFEGELCTPTSAAIIKYFVDEYVE